MSPRPDNEGITRQVRDRDVNVGKRIDPELLADAQKTSFWRSTYSEEKKTDASLTPEKFYLNHQSYLEREMGL